MSWIEQALQSRVVVQDLLAASPGDAAVALRTSLSGEPWYSLHRPIENPVMLRRMRKGVAYWLRHGPRDAAFDVLVLRAAVRVRALPQWAGKVREGSVDTTFSVVTPDEAIAFAAAVRERAGRDFVRACTKLPPWMQEAYVAGWQTSRTSLPDWQWR